MKGFENISEYASYITKRKIIEEYYFYYMIDNENIAFMHLDNYDRIILKVNEYKHWLRNIKIKKLIKKQKPLN
jgi:hypothetical protein